MSLPLAHRLRSATRTLHAQVERSGLMHRLLRGELPRAGYCALLRSLHVVYAALEQGLQRHAGHAQIAPLMRPALPRLDALQRDLAHLHGDDWPTAIRCAPAALRYAAHLRLLADSRPGLLAAHAYVRYLGDLNGGQALARIVARSLSLAGPDGIAFYDFGSREEADRLAAAVRGALDSIAKDEAAAQALVDEACAAFGRHAELFDELACAEVTVLRAAG